MDSEDNCPMTLSEWRTQSYREYDPQLGAIGAQIEVLGAVEIDPFQGPSSTPHSGRQPSVSNLDYQNLINVCFNGSGFEVPAVFDHFDYHNFSEFTGLEEEVNTASSQSSPMSMLCDDRISNQQDITENFCFENLISSMQQEISSGRSERDNNDLKTVRRFKTGWEHLKSKVLLMDSRTGSKTTMHAVLNSIVYFMDNKGRSRVRDTNHSGFNIVNISEGSGVEGDHPYAAVILTQKESSPSVRDHQYNEPAFDRRRASPPYLDQQEACIKGPLIKHRYKRDRQFVSSLKSLFLKKKSLGDCTGAQIILEVTYEGKVFNSHNYKTAEDVLRQNRKELFRVPVVATVDSSSHSRFPSTSPQIIVNVTRTRVVDQNTPAVQMRFVRNNTSNSRKSRNVGYIRATSSDTVSQQKHTSQDSEVPEIPDHSYGLSESDPRNESKLGHRDSDSSDFTSASGPPSISASVTMVRSPQEEICNGRNDTFTTEELDGPRGQFSFLNQPTTTVGTNTEQICAICLTQRPPGINNSNGPKPFWIRCSNALCHYTIHPVCIGFQIHSNFQLTMLPPFLCPDHRSS